MAIKHATIPAEGTTGQVGYAEWNESHVVDDGTLTIAKTTGLQAALDGKEAAGTAASSIASHEAASNPHPTYLTQAEGDALYKPISQPSPLAIVPIHAAAGTAITLTNQTNTLLFLANSDRHITRVDLSTYTQVRLVARVSTGSASANSPRLIAVYRTAFSTTVGDYSDIGTSSVQISMTTAGLIVSSWVDLATSAKADVFVGITQNGGDGVADPALGSILLQFR